MVSISAVIPAYNAEQFICYPIQSILNQTYEISEIIVVDDGSSDRTAEAAGQFPNTRVIRRPNGGQAAARNTGIHAASGEWIAFLDHDDEWTPRKTEIQVRYITPEAGVIHGNTFDPIHFGRLWHRQAHVTPSGALVRKQALLEVGGFDECRAVMGVEDLTLWLKIALTDWKFIKSEADLYTWRQTGQNQSMDEGRMLRADLATIELAGLRVRCQPEEIERVKDASKIEYARNMIAREQWEQAAQLLETCTPGLATRWLSLARMLKTNRLARASFVKWLHGLDAGYTSHICAGQCDLPEPQRQLCIQSCSQPYFSIVNG